MKRFAVASGAALASTGVGVANSVAVVRLWDQDLAAEFFQVSSLAMLVGVVGELGLGNYAVHDSARVRGSDDEPAYVRAVMREAVRRGGAAAIVGAVCGWAVFGFDTAGCIAAAAATVGIVIGIVAQSVFRGLGQDVVASFAGPVGATVLVGVFVLLGAFGRTVDPLYLAAAGYAGIGVASAAVLRRRARGAHTASFDVSIRRTVEVGISNVCNAAGRQLDIWIAAAVLTGAAFNSYALAAKIAASIGVVAYAAAQATAADTRRWTEGDASAGRAIQHVHRLALSAIVILSVVAIAIGPPLGRWVFGAEIEISRVVLTIILAGYVLGATAGPTLLVLVVIERSDLVLRSAVAALMGAVTATTIALALEARAVAAAVFLLAWLALVAGISAVLAHRATGLRTFVLGFPPRRSSPR